MTIRNRIQKIVGTIGEIADFFLWYLPFRRRWQQVTFVLGLYALFFILNPSVYKIRNRIWNRSQPSAVVQGLTVTIGDVVNLTTDTPRGRIVQVFFKPKHLGFEGIPTYSWTCSEEDAAQLVEGGLVKLRVLEGNPTSIIDVLSLDRL